jgi:sulfhydrogenase subunit delta
MNKKLKIGIFSLTCCEGCEFAILDLGEKLFKLTEKVDIVNFRLLEDNKHPKVEKYDAAFVEGSPITKENEKTLKEIRKNSKILIALGNCAAMGGVHQIKNWGDKEKINKSVYKYWKQTENPNISRLDEVVKVDFTIPACPIVGEEFLEIIYQLINGRKLKEKTNPVCYECQTNGYACLLQKGQICLGPVTAGGCGAVCLSGSQPCWGCRGKIKNSKGSGEAIANLLSHLTKNYSKEKIEWVKEFFGIKKEL